jgi:hypothetical protein
MLNVTLGEVKTQEKPFPKLMKSKIGAVVLFWEPNKGLYLFSEPGSIDAGCEGELMNGVDWPKMNIFTDYNEPITIQNA